MNNPTLLHLKRKIEDNQILSIEDIQNIKATYHLSHVKDGVYNAVFEHFIGEGDILSPLLIELSDPKLSKLYAQKRFGWQLAVNATLTPNDCQFIRKQGPLLEVAQSLENIFLERYQGGLQLQWLHLIDALPLNTKCAFAIKRFEKMLNDKIYTLSNLEKKLFIQCLNSGLFTQNCAELVHTKLHFHDHAYKIDFNLNKLAWVELFGSLNDKRNYRYHCLSNLFALNDKDLNQAFLRFYRLNHCFTQSFSDAKFLESYGALVKVCRSKPLSEQTKALIQATLNVENQSI